jgi:23S rRNA (guanosine2251-2'-O)-methyltransferase
MEVYLIAHNIRSAHNVGSIFRTADGAGVSKIFLVGYTPAPIDRFGREHPEILKTSLGATTSVAWESRDDIGPLLDELRAQGMSIVAVEQHERSIQYRTSTLRGDRVYIFGNEIDGVPDSICKEADEVWEIPMRGKKESLNVSVSVGIVLFSQ